MIQAEELAQRNVSDATWWRANAAYSKEMIAYCSVMRRKYEYAARFPWLAVASDPPEPRWGGNTSQATDELTESLGSNYPAQNTDSVTKFTNSIVEQPRAGPSSQ
jgi:hypothetical protein